MNIIPYFTLEEKIQFLKKRGYTVKTINIEMGYPCYHNDMEYENEEVWAVYVNNVEYLRPCGYNFKKEDWLDSVFKDEMTKKFKNILLN